MNAYMPDLAGSDAVILDVETTTNKDTPERPLEVIELAFKRLSGLPEATVVFRYKPRMPSSWGALAIHHILPEELEGMPPSERARADAPLADFWIGHNVDFDWKALGSPPGVRRICTLALSRSLWPELDSHTLTAMTYFTKGAKPETREALRSAHSAAADIAHCANLLALTVAQLKPSSMLALWSYSEEARIPKKMAFGKFAGQPISAVDKGYAGWYSRTEDPDPYVLMAFRRAGLLR